MRIDTVGRDDLTGGGDQPTVLDGAADDGLLFLPEASGLAGGRLRVGPASTHPQLEGEVIGGHPRDDGFGDHGDVGRAVEGEDQGGVGGGQSGQGSRPIGRGGRRWEQVHLSPHRTYAADRTRTTKQKKQNKIQTNHKSQN